MGARQNVAALKTEQTSEIDRTAGTAPMAEIGVLSVQRQRPVAALAVILVDFLTYLTVNFDVLAPSQPIRTVFTSSQKQFRMQTHSGEMK